MERAGRIEVAVFSIALALRLALIAQLPVMPFGDSYARMSEPLELVKSVWLPGYQATLATIALLFDDPLALRVITAVQGAAASALGAWCARRWLGARAAPMVGLGIATLPSFVFPSINLYQEPLLLALAFGGLGLIRARGLTHPATMLVFGLACLTRYEAWALALLCTLASRSWRGLGFLAAPAAWTLYHRAITPYGAQSLHIEPSLARVTERFEVFGQLIWAWGALPVVLAGAVVLAASLVRRPRLQVPLGLGALTVAVVLTLAVIDPYSSVDNPRQLQLPLAMALLLASAGPGLVWPTPRFLPWPGAALVVVPAAIAFPSARAHQRDDRAARAVAAGRLLHDSGWTSDLFVLGQGFPQYPDAPTLECEAVRAYTRGEVRCDFEGMDVLPPGTQTVVQLFALEPWRPVQRQAMEATRDAAQWRPVVLGPFAVWRRRDAPAPVAPPPSVQTAAGPNDGCDALPSANLPDLTLHGGVMEPTRLAFYSVGSASFASDKAGHLLVYPCGTPAAGALPHFTATVGDLAQTYEVTRRYQEVDLGQIAAGTPVELKYEDDLVDQDGADRNLFFAAVTVVAPRASP